MPKRKAVVPAAEEILGLTQLSDGLLEQDSVANGKVANGTTPNRKSRERKSNVDEELDEGTEVTPKRSKKRKVETKEDNIVDIGVNGDISKKRIKRERKAKEKTQAEAMPLALRSLGPRLFIGAHVSGAGGVQNSVANAVRIGANAFALFLKSQRKWSNPPLANEACTSFHDNCNSHSYDQAKYVVPHGSYLVNLAHTDKVRTEQAYAAFLDDLKRCERLGIKLYNFHPGVANSTGGDRPAAIAHLASNLNRVHKDTSSVVTVLENMAAGGNVLGSTFEDLRDIIALIDDKDRVGVCLDTCHAFAAGYDLRTADVFQSTMEAFNETVGLNYLRALHVNDSKAPLASKRDLHANIGTGFLGLRAFRNIINYEPFHGLPMILETPLEARDENGVPLKDEKGNQKEDNKMWAREIKLLESLFGMDVESEEFLKLERDLAKKGEPQRKRLSDQIDKKREKEEKKAKNQKEKGKKKGKKDDAEDESANKDLLVMSNVGPRVEDDGLEDGEDDEFDGFHDVDDF